MDIESFYTDHWKEIEPERISRYEQMFLWQDAQKALLEPAELLSGHDVLDIGSGPGFFAGGLADMVAPQGKVDGVDINAQFVAGANDRFADNPRVNFHQVNDHNLPFADASFDRVICKNVLEYVPDVAATLAEIHRVLRPGGRLHVIDSDWGFVVVEPWASPTVYRFFEAAAPAFNEPYIGRHVAGYMMDAGLEAPKVRLSPFVDQSGRGLHVLRNMAGYIRTFNTMDETEVEGLLRQVEAALEEGRFLFCLPQFLVTAAKRNNESDAGDN